MTDRRLFAHEIEARLDDLLLLSLRQRSGAKVALDLEALARPMQERVLQWVAVAAHSSTDLGWLVARLASANLAWLDEWMQAGLAAFDQGALVAAEAALTENEQVSLSRTSRKAVSFENYERRLAGFLLALAGRPLKLAPADVAWTDTETLWLPRELEPDLPAEKGYRCYKSIVALLWAQIEFGTFDVDLEQMLSCWPDQDIALAWLAAFEAIRLEARLASELPGLASDMRHLRGAWPVAISVAEIDLQRPESTVVDSVRWTHSLMASMRDAAANEAVVWPPRFPQIGILDPVAVHRRRAVLPVPPSAQTNRAVNLLRGAGGGQAVDSRVAPIPMAGIGDADPGDSPVDLPASRSRRSVKPDASMPEPPCAGAQQAAGYGVWSPTTDGDRAIVPDSQMPPDARYDEWDYRRQAWRRDWCQLFEGDSTAGEATWAAEVKQRHTHLIRSMRRRFAALLGEDRIHSRQLEGEDIDLDAHVEARGDRKRGGDGSPRLFMQRQRSDRSLAVMFMVDMSGSTKGWVNDAERESLLMMCEAIDALGDRYAIYGFSGWTRARCDIYRVKRFSDRYDATVQRRIAGIEAKDYTRMGVAVRHLSGLLGQQPTRHKLLITLSDGRPDDYGDEYRGRYGIEDTRHALLEAREKGIRSFCITIDRHGADYLPQLYGPAQFAVIDDAKKLPRKIAEIYRHLTV